MEHSDAHAKGPRQRMPLEDRAKIFVPFDPLHGFREALREKERQVEEAADGVRPDAWPKRGSLLPPGDGREPLL